MKKNLLISAAITLVLVAIFASTQIDDELSDEALALISIIEEPKESRAYIYLLGINASPNVSPMEVGGSLLQEYRKQGADENYEIVGYTAQDQIQAPEGELFCEFADDHCVRTLFTTDFDIEELERKYAIILERMGELYGLGDYHTLSKPTYREPIPPYQYISRVERVWVLRSISLYKEGRANKAQILLRNRLSMLRSSLASQDNLIGKMVHLLVISEIVDTLSIILSHSADATKMELIPDMTLAEKDLGAASAREFGVAYYLFKRLDKYPGFFDSTAAEGEGEKGEKDVRGGKVPGWFVRIFYKPNMSINAVVPAYTKLVSLSRLSCKEFAEEIERGKELEITTSNLRNYMGNVLINTGRPNLEQYLGRIMDVEAKIELFNQIYHHGAPEDKVKNPYYEYDYSYRKEDSICFRGPLEDQKGMRCLRTKY
jgi:hypothetical protein